jgi:hypothetical protein
MLAFVLLYTQRLGEEGLVKGWQADRLQVGRTVEASINKSKNEIKF